MIVCTEKHKELFKEWSGRDYDEVMQLSEEERNQVGIDHIIDHMADKDEKIACIAEDLIMFLDFGHDPIDYTDEDEEEGWE